MTTLTFDEINYSKLLAEIAPRAIETEEEYDRLLAVAERLTFAKNLTPEERALYKLLVTLIKVYETENYPMDKSEPHEILQHVMESSGMDLTIRVSPEMLERFIDSQAKKNKCECCGVAGDRTR